MKKLISIMLVLTMVLSLGVTAFAADTTGSITIQSTVNDKSYELYRVFDLTYSGDNVSYTINADWGEFFSSDAGKGYIVDSNNEDSSLNAITVNGAVKYINITDANVAAFATAAQAYAVDQTPTATATGTGSDVTVSNLALGYYLVYPVGASEITEGNSSVCSLTSTVPNGTVSIKAKTPTIEKKDDTADADVGDTVNYTITGEVPDTTGYETFIYTINDTMSDGLTYKNDAVVKIAGTAINDATISHTVNADGTTSLTITIPVKSYTAGAAITVTYSATINSKAVASVENNSATLTYSNNPDYSGNGTPEDPNETETTTPDEETVYTSKIVIDKVDGNDDTKKLAGATFVLYKEVTAEGATEATKLYYSYKDGNVDWVTNKEQATSVTTNEIGAASFDGLANGTYYLEETVAPAGYNLLTEAQKVIVNGSETETSLTSTATVANNAGTVLPSTGGMGTTMFYIIGGLLVAAAAVLLVTKKRMSVEG